MGIDLRALLVEESGGSGEWLVVSEEDGESEEERGVDDVCAGERVRIVLELMPHREVAARPVQGTIGVQGQLPVFIGGGVTFGEVGGVLQALYRTFCDQYVPPDAGGEMGEEKRVAAVPLADEGAEELALF